MQRFLRIAVRVSAAFVLVGLSTAQEPTPDRVTVPLKDPSRPGLVKVSIMNGAITVTAYDGKEVVVEARPRSGGSRRSARSGERNEGLKRLPITSTGLTVSEDNNVVEVICESHTRGVDLAIQVPAKTSLKLNAVNGGNIKVERVQGEIEATNVNGGVTLTGISGSAVAHALNGGVVVVFHEVTPSKPMSFSSMNGKIDVTFPENLKANVVMKTDNGDVYSDFDIRLDQTSRQPIVEDSRGKGGKYRVRIDKAVYGTINNGGPELHFKNFNGDIYIRKAGK